MRAFPRKPRHQRKQTRLALQPNRVRTGKLVAAARLGVPLVVLAAAGVSVAVGALSLVGWAVLLVVVAALWIPYGSRGRAGGSP